MRPIYNDELYHFGILGMKWGHHKIKQIQKANKDYKTKINKIANSKTAHKADIAAAKAVNTGLHKRVGKELTSVILATLVADAFTGKTKEYKNMSSKDVIEKMISIGKKAATKIAIDEATARSVANKYNTKGNRVKGSNKELFTREQLVKTGVRAVNTTIMLAPLARLGLGIVAKSRDEQRRAAEEAFNRWGTRILTDKVSDYSHIVPNVRYTVR